jgi:tRNA (cytidine/uridine-2'-O-)-methyltransferase
MKIVLFQPDIPQNTGNIVRTCSVTNVSLVLVKPLGFRLCNRMAKRAGLDYWEEVSIEEIDDLEEFLKDKSSFYFFSSKAKILFTEVEYTKESLLIFGSETKGLPERFFSLYPERFVTIPMKPASRCLNLANSAAIGLYEALRQQKFAFSSADLKPC